MSVDQLIAEYKALPIEERQKVAEVILADDSWVPESFRQGMKDIEEGRVVDMETALYEKPPGAE
jgi:predicted transcriptional regulator